MLLAGIQKKAAELFDPQQTYSFPINPILIGRANGLYITPYLFGDEIAVVLAIEEDRGKIGFDTKLSNVTRRFAVAHAIGHFFLHRYVNTLFVDKRFFLSRELTRGKQADFKYETQAHEFALALLLPEALLRKEVEVINLDLADDEALKLLAKKCEVSATALFLRLWRLKMI